MRAVAVSGRPYLVGPIRAGYVYQTLTDAGRVGAVSDFEVLLFCVLTGFVTAGTAASFYQLLTSRPPDFELRDFTFPAIATCTLMCFTAGPFIVVRRICGALRVKKAGLEIVVLGLAVAGLWSACSGTLFLSFLVAVRA
ncbi:hypothetical protein J2R99_002737 [Rhodopseudomonas julia]|uniref:Uncharacterized protein n=1 Tax=Rhodopseudomonas julia TaxID=200617 RepID=A0ABU0C8L1_9BRAD|nr:hypothetical protein [Rhodopseudomonas julia]MDQ0326868.1 hypothetical protein [Rhodopseudomonas julia]